MKRQLAFIILALALVACASSCDTFRRLAGRPTSKDIEEMKVRIEAERKSEEDSLRTLEIKRLAAAEAAADSIAADARLRASGYRLQNKAVLDSQVVTPLEHTYYIIIGAFRNENYAAVSFEKIKAAGFEPCYIEFASGLKAVALTGVDSLSAALDLRDRIAAETFVPKEAWILSTK